MSPHDTPTEPRILAAPTLDAAVRIEDLWGRALELLSELHRISPREISPSLQVALSRTSDAFSQVSIEFSKASKIARRDGR